LHNGKILSEFGFGCWNRINVELELVVIFIRDDIIVESYLSISKKRRRMLLLGVNFKFAQGLGK